MNMFSKVFGTRSQREVKRIMPLVKKIEDLRPEMQKLTDEELRSKTREYLEWSISKYSLSVESYFIRAVSPR